MSLLKRVPGSAKLESDESDRVAFAFVVMLLLLLEAVKKDVGRRLMARRLLFVVVVVEEVDFSVVDNSRRDGVDRNMLILY